MSLSQDEGKARRLQGMKQAKLAMTTAQKIHRALVNGRPPAGELKTPLAAVTAARVLLTELEVRMRVAGLTSGSGNCAVSIGYVTADLSVVGTTHTYALGRENALLELLNGNIMLGLLFGIVDTEASDEDSGVVVGLRSFLGTKQAEGWLGELVPVFRCEVSDPL